MTAKAFICGVEGTRLTDEERAFLSEHQPYGVILFARNCTSPEQLKALNAEIISCLTHPYAQILIDQEGGRVARLKPPHWRKYPPAKFFADIEDDAQAAMAVRLNACILAEELRSHGITMDCAPVVDVLAPECHEVIGDRAFGEAAERVALLAGAQAEGLMDAGILPIVKHIPGHGRAQVDSHLELPIVKADLATLEAVDFKAFQLLHHLPLAMTAHVIFTALDAHNPATISPTVIHYIRKHIGFNGLLMSDDISMKALHGTMAGLTEAVLHAGCDLVLHCNGNMQEMVDIAAHCPKMTANAQMRAARAQQMLPEIPVQLEEADYVAWQGLTAQKAA